MRQRAVSFLAAAVLMASGLMAAGCSPGSPLGGSTASPSGQDPDLTSPPDPTVPYSGEVTQQISPGPGQPAPGDPPLEIKWYGKGRDSEQKRADADACYRFAWSQVDNDVRIDDDISSARNEAFSQNSRLTVHTQRVDSYYYERERNARFGACMRSKGYDVD